MGEARGIGLGRCQLQRPLDRRASLFGASHLFRCVGKNEAARGQQQQAVGGKAGRQAGRQGGEARRARCGWLGRDAICTSEAALTAGCSDTVRESGKRLRND